MLTCCKTWKGEKGLRRSTSCMGGSDFRGALQHVPLQTGLSHFQSSWPSLDSNGTARRLSLSQPSSSSCKKRRRKSQVESQQKKKKKLLSHWERGELEQTRFYFRQSCIPLPLRIKTRWCSKTVVLLHGANAVHSKDNNHSGAKTKSSEKREEKLFKVLDYANRYLARGLLELNNVSEDYIFYTTAASITISILHLWCKPLIMPSTSDVYKAAASFSIVSQFIICYFLRPAVTREARGVPTIDSVNIFLMLRNFFCLLRV